MSRIDTTFARLAAGDNTSASKEVAESQSKSASNLDHGVHRSVHRSALVCFVTAGYPDIETSRNIINNLPKNGADIVEIGIPFSDAAADGEEIREASRCALNNGVNLSTILDMAQDFRANNPDTPLILMGYYNPIFHYGVERFVKDARRVKIDGLIIVDLPPEEEDELVSHLNVDDDDPCLIHLITPTTDAARLTTITAKARGFLYYVSITGVTGSSSPQLQKVQQHITSLNPTLPVAVGFGIKSSEQASKFGEIGQAVVIGSALIKTLRESKEAGDDSAKMQNKLSQQVGEYAMALK